MRLRILDGHFFGNVDAAQKSCRFQGDQIDGAQGVMFQCPACSSGKPPGQPDGIGFAGAHYIRVCFSNPRNAPVAPVAYDDNPRWEMTGASLDDLTLKPSINLDVPLTADEQRWYVEHPNVVRCVWHGFVTNGDAA